MPIVEEGKINWAQEIDEKDTEVEFNEESGFKKVIEYKSIDEKKFKITNIFRVEKVKIPKLVAERKELKKFGASEQDPAGVNSATTVASDEVFMQFLTNKDESEKIEVAPLAVPALIKCRLCKGDHWSAKCPHKELLEGRMSEQAAKEASTKPAAESSSAGAGGAYKPPSLRAGAPAAAAGKRFGDFGRSPMNKDDFTVRVSNLPEEATEIDLMELFKPFGKVSRIFLAKDKNKQISRGFAFVTFLNKDDAQRSIWAVNDYGYNHLILKVEWAKPSKDQ